MFEAFTKKKFDDYSELVEFKDNAITFPSIRNSNLPPFVINFFDCYLPHKPIQLQKSEFEEILSKAIVFNINYIIKPKSTLLKFLFGKMETKPCEFVTEKLNYFQFYSYYINHIEEFIGLNSPLTISSNHISGLIDEVNDKILIEITDPSSSDVQRLNLIKLLYYYFQDLTKNNPINIKIPKKILSAFFADKGFNEIKARVDNFFSEEIFIQEMIELMKPQVRKEKPQKEESDAAAAKKILMKIKSDLLVTELSDKEIEISQKKAIQEKETENIPLPADPEIKDLRDAEFLSGEKKITEPVLNQDLYSENLVLAAGLEESIPSGTVPDHPEPVTEDEKKLKIINDLFHEDSSRRRIIKKLFKRDIKAFTDTIKVLLDSASWDDASMKIQDFFDKNRIDYSSGAAVKFVDLLQNYFADNPPIIRDRMQSTGNT